MKKVLIVDDEADVLKAISKRLTTDGYSVITATNGREAITAAQSQQPDIILLDIKMPDMDGAEVIAKLKGHPSTDSIPVILLTATLSKAEEEKYGSIIGYITLAKPFDTEKLLEHMERLLQAT